MTSRSDALDLVYLCDWLPPDFGAVGQYSQLFAEELARDGQRVVLIGLSSREDGDEERRIGEGSLRTIRIKTATYDKTAIGRRMIWTAGTNTRLLLKALPYMRRAKAVLFTGSPPLLLHWIAPLNLLLRKTLIYRITDFHPECAIAERGSPSFLLGLILQLTLFWRRRVSAFEILGLDQGERLSEIGIPRERMRLKPDPSPVTITDGTKPLARPPGTEGKTLLLYSGNWGVAHDHDTFLEAYIAHHQRGSGKVLLWLNSVGRGTGIVSDRLRAAGVPFVSGKPVPLEALASLLVTPDAHLITLSDAFVGYVLPSKVHGCLKSNLPILYIGSEKSDVHRLCAQRGHDYHRVDVGDAAGVAQCLERLAKVPVG